jgi:hypothetical protein
MERDQLKSTAFRQGHSGKGNGHQNMRNSSEILEKFLTKNKNQTTLSNFVQGVNDRIFSLHGPCHPLSKETSPHTYSQSSSCLCSWRPWNPTY